MDRWQSRNRPVKISHSSEARCFISFVLILEFLFTPIQHPKESFGVIKNLHIPLNKREEQFNEGNIGHYLVIEIKFEEKKQQHSFFITSSNSISIVDQLDWVCTCLCISLCVQYVLSKAQWDMKTSMTWLLEDIQTDAEQMEVTSSWSDYTDQSETDMTFRTENIMTFVFYFHMEQIMAEFNVAIKVSWSSV